jgi:serine/threonine protein kinase
MWRLVERHVKQADSSGGNSMQRPKTADDFLSLLQKSNLLENARFEQLKQKLAEAPTPITDPSRLAALLIREHVLTRFQADQILQGRSKGFWVNKKYKILDQVGIGGMARVFLAEHIIMRRKVALKVLPTAKCAEPASLARFLREARAIASIHHPNVIRAYDIDQDSDFYYIVLEYAEGETVAQFVEKHGPIPWPQACDYVYQAAAGLEHLLSCGLIHRDIKPSNIIIEHHGTVKLVDLGLAVFFEEKELDPLTIKYEQNVLGTADYLAPEQAIDSHNVDGRADIYSLGATFCFMLCGESPFPNGTVMEKLHAHQTEPFKTIRDRAPDVPKDLDAILRKMLAKQPKDRFASMTELRAAIRRFLPINSVSAQLSGTFAMLNGHGQHGSADAAETPIHLAHAHHAKSMAPPSPTSKPTPKSDVRLAEKHSKPAMEIAPGSLMREPLPPAPPGEDAAEEIEMESDSESTDGTKKSRFSIKLSRPVLLALAGAGVAILAMLAAAWYFLL